MCCKSTSTWPRQISGLWTWPTAHHELFASKYATAPSQRSASCFSRLMALYKSSSSSNSSTSIDNTLIIATTALHWALAKLNETRLPSNLRQNPRMRAFRSPDKDGGYTIRSAVPENPMLHANITTLCLMERSYCLLKFYIAGIGIFDLFSSCTLTLTRWPSYMNSTRIPWRYTACAKMNFLCPLFWKLSSCTYGHTDTTKII